MGSILIRVLEYKVEDKEEVTGMQDDFLLNDMSLFGDVIWLNLTLEFPPPSLLSPETAEFFLLSNRPALDSPFDTFLCGDILLVFFTFSFSWIMNK
jgi:hypothetical protein